MLKTGIIYSLLLGFALSVTGQNLVPNGSFEEIKKCPESRFNTPHKVAEHVKHWYSPTPRTPDLFHRCSPVVDTFLNINSAGVPRHNFVVYGRCVGKQEPHSGDAYMGIGLGVYINTYNEYIQTKLSEPLKAGYNYRIEFYVAPSVCSQIVTSDMGAYLSNDSLTNWISDYDNPEFGKFVPEKVPQIKNESGLLSNVGAWTKISGFYRAQGGEKFVTIGGFMLQPNPGYIDSFKTGERSFSYYYIDDVSVELFSGLYAKEDNICIGDSVQIEVVYDSAFYTSLSPEGSDTFQLASTFTVSPQKTTSYYLCNGTGCFDSIQITVAHPLILKLPKQIAFCQGDSSTLNAFAGEANYSWNNGESSPEITVKEPGKYIVHADNTCLSADTATVTVYQLPQPKLEKTISRCFDEEGFIQLSPGAFAQYLWFPDLITGSSLWVEKPGVYSVTVSDTNNCSNSTETVITDGCKASVFIPNAFSPDNNDGLNDDFLPVMHNVVDFEMSIYNRWGENIFITNNKNQGWNGTYKNSNCPAGLYMYRINYTGIQGNTAVENGMLMLLR